MKKVWFVFSALLFFSLPASAQRITLASHSPIMTTSQPSKSVIFVDCWKWHAGVVYWNGSTDAMMPLPGCEVAISAIGLNANDVFDVVGTASGPCFPTNGSGAGWSGDGGSLTARGTGYSKIDETLHAYPTNANAISHCMSGSTDLGPIAANQASLIGAVCTDTAAAGKISYVRGYAAPGGGPARLCVWNVVDEPLKTEVVDNGTNWTFIGYLSGGSIVNIENLDNQTSGGVGNQVVFLSGLPRYSPSASIQISSGSSNDFPPTVMCGVGFSLDHSGNTSPDHLADFLTPQGKSVAADDVGWGTHGTIEHSYEPLTGIHVIQAQETTDGYARCWFRNVNGQRDGLSFRFNM